MKIQILGVPRTGTTSLLNGIGAQGYLKIGEPFNYNIRIKDVIPYPIPELKSEGKVCVKSITSQTPNKPVWPQGFKGEFKIPSEVIENFSNSNQDRVIKFQTEFCKQFDKVILLDRKNEIEHWKSYQNLINKINLNETSTTNKDYRPDSIITFSNTIFKPWYEEELTQKLTDKLIRLGWQERFQMEKTWMKELSEKMNIPITYYEDLYGEDRMYSFDIINKWGLDLDPFILNDYLNPKYKLKQTGKKPII